METESQIRARFKKQLEDELESLTHWTDGRTVLTKQEFVSKFGANIMEAVCVGGWEGCRFEESLNE